MDKILTIGEFISAVSIIWFAYREYRKGVRSKKSATEFILLGCGMAVMTIIAAVIEG